MQRLVIKTSVVMGEQQPASAREDMWSWDFIYLFGLLCSSLGDVPSKLYWYMVDYRNKSAWFRCFRY